MQCLALLTIWLVCTLNAFVKEQPKFLLVIYTLSNNALIWQQIALDGMLHLWRQDRQKRFEDNYL